VQQSLHVLDGGGEGQGPNIRRIAIEGHNVGPPGGAISKDENLAPPLIAKVQKLVAGAAQEARKIEIACLKRWLLECLLFS
jgi:hypothetical protein